MDLPAHGDADGTGADVPPAAVEPEPMEMHAPADPAVVEAVALARLRLLTPYAFYDDDGLFKAWDAGTIVTDPDEIELLMGRKAPVERIEE